MVRAADTSARVPYALVALLALALLINYVDRGSLAIAGPLLEKEFDLSPAEMGWLLSLFFWTYVPGQPVMGWLVDRLGAERVLLAGVATWCLATALAGLVQSVLMLAALRLLMGAGEASYYPSALSLLCRRVDVVHRGRAMAVVQFGSIIGPAIGAFVGGLIMVEFGWRMMFALLGVASMLWLFPWLRQMRRPRAEVAAVATGPNPTYAQILAQRALWGGMLGTFCSNFAFYYVWAWLPLYLVNAQGLSLLSMTYVTAAFYVVDGTSVLVAGLLLDTWVRRGASLNRAYKTALGLSSAGVGTCLILCASAPPAVAAGLLLLTGLMDGLNSPSNPAVTQTFAGPHATGRWMGLQNAVGNLSGIICPVVTGYLVQSTGNYRLSLYVAGGVALCGMFAWLVVTPRVAPVDWSTPDPHHDQITSDKDHP